MPTPSLRSPRNTLFAAALASTSILAGGATPAGAVMPIVSEAFAREAAVKILLGEPYGKTPEAVFRVLSAGRFAQAGEKPICAENGAGAWVFSVATTHEGRPLKGTIQIKAANGAFDCANLPFLD